MNAPVSVPTQPDVIYPERDGKPMGETEAHHQVIIHTTTTLQDYFRDQPAVHVGGNLLLYYEAGNPAAVVVPDVFVVHGMDKHLRRTYKLWEEGQPPDIVFEFTSRSTKREDVHTKPALYARLGITEYVLFDPLGEYLRPALQAFRLQQGQYAPVEIVHNTFTSEVLELGVHAEGRHLLFSTPAGERLLMASEAFEARRAEADARQAEAKARRAEAKARRAAEQRVRDTQAELERLRAELAQLRSEE